MSNLVTLHPWFEARVQHLAKLHNDGRLPHALLLHGMPGIGKADFAKAFAQMLLCQQPIDGKACGHCKPCELNAAGSHPDLFLLAPDEPGKQLKVDQVRALNEFIYSTAQQGGYRVVILNPADSMNTASANALLKMLEEPGADTLILLLTSKIGQLLPTIKSRCQHIECHPPAEHEAIQWLMNASDLDEDRAKSILHINLGAPMEALAYIENGLNDQRAQLVRGLADILKQRRTALEVAQSWNKLDLELILGWFYSLLIDAARGAVCETGDVIRQDDARNMLNAVAKKTNPVKIFKLADKVHEERKAILLRQNPNKQLLLECILLEWAALLN
ncbi:MULTISPECIES: DNA polymerase III subunit delta' [unclassified Neptuniibacter]|uniref:DNA polymerase III subunit delta' n=1 Tax=unclassified Neptuniibacter TaxID=2630693 RepID=UPI000C496D1F|nr:MULTISPECIES: DNA polymerase III subunit delta' [unclassified Neptuniibacter]MAY43555.1 DNA polymerase III subunit delta' [Oceanospirillaceae bacterium]|tara:strand:- start:15548 stop:16543 length:996 start_codon:yes stop_codon:yes gene_type:complete